MTRVWAKKGTRPRVIRQLQYEYVYLFGAVCPATGKSVGLVMPVVNHEAMQLHLEAISQQLESGKHAVIVLDRAAWHTTKKLNKFTNISILPLPPVSPELNPVEQVWQYLRDKYMANRAFEDYEEIVSSCCDSWMLFSRQISQIKSLCFRPWTSLCH